MHLLFGMGGSLLRINVSSYSYIYIAFCFFVFFVFFEAGRGGGCGYRLDPRLLKFLESGGQFVRSPHSIEEVKPLQMIGTLFETSESRTSLYEYGEHTSPTGEL